MALSDNDINIKIKYETEGTDELEDAKKQTEDLGKNAKAQKDDLDALNLVNKLNVSSMKSLGASAVSLASKLGVAGIAFGTTYKIAQTAVNVVRDFTAKNERLQSSYSTLNTTVNTQSGTLMTNEQVQKDVKQASEDLGITQTDVTTALTRGVDETNNYDLSLQAVYRAAGLASDGVGDFQTNYEQMIGAYTGSFKVYDDTSRLLQPGLDAYNTYYEQVKVGSNDTLAVQNQNQQRFRNNLETLQTNLGADLEPIKQTWQTEFADMLGVLASDSWTDAINVFIIRPLNNLIEMLTGFSFDGWKIGDKYLIPPININPVKNLIPELKGSSKYISSNEGTPNYASVPDPSQSLGGFGVSGATNVSVNVEGNVWTTNDLVDSISDLLFNKLKLRGAR